MSTCYRHPGRETSVSCSNCGRPICTDCMIAAPVGIKCPECAKQPRSARASIKPSRAGYAIGAAIGGGAVIGFLASLLANSLGILFAIFAAYLIGLAMGQIVYVASGHYRSKETAWIAVGGAVWAYVFPLFLFAISVVGVGLDDIFVSVIRAPLWLLGAAIAGYVAYRRVL